MLLPGLSLSVDWRVREAMVIVGLDMPNVMSGAMLDQS